MKVALLLDILDQFGGAERMTQQLFRMYPDAHLYTMVINKRTCSLYFPFLNQSHTHTSGFPLRLTNHQSICQLVSPLVWTFNLEEYDVVISNSSHLFCNINPVDKPINIQYIQTPPKNIFGIEPMTPTQRIIPYTNVIKRTFINALRRADAVIANSRNTQQKIKRVTGEHSEVIYPPVQVPAKDPVRKTPQFFLCVSRIDNLKGLELAVAACSHLGVPLKIVGYALDRRYMEALKANAGPTVEFLGELPDEEIEKLYQSSRAFLFPSFDEDFGIAPVEAMAHGVPVIAYYGGGTKETVVEGKTGLFFREYTARSLEKVMRDLSRHHFDSKKLYQHAKLFSELRFQKEMSRLVKRLYERRNLS